LIASEFLALDKLVWWQFVVSRCVVLL